MPFRPHITAFLKLYCHFAQKNLKIIPVISANFILSDSRDSPRNRQYRL